MELETKKETVDTETGEVKATTEESSATEMQEKTTDELMEELNQSDDAYAREILEAIGVDSKYWDKEFPIKEGDVVAVLYGIGVDGEEEGDSLESFGYDKWRDGQAM